MISSCSTWIRNYVRFEALAAAVSLTRTEPTGDGFESQRCRDLRARTLSLARVNSPPEPVRTVPAEGAACTSRSWHYAHTKSKSSAADGKLEVRYVGSATPGFFSLPKEISRTVWTMYACRQIKLYQQYWRWKAPLFTVILWNVQYKWEQITLTPCAGSEKRSSNFPTFKRSV